MTYVQKTLDLEYCKLQATFMQPMASIIRTFSSFKCNKPVAVETFESQDSAFQTAVDTMLNDRTLVWNSVENYELYQYHGGSKLSRRTLTLRLSDTLPELLVLSGNGIANILIFRNQASIKFKIFATESDEDLDHSLNKLAKKIPNESAEMRRDGSTFDKRSNLDDALCECSPAFLALLSAVFVMCDES